MLNWRLPLLTVSQFWKIPALPEIKILYATVTATWISVKKKEAANTLKMHKVLQAAEYHLMENCLQNNFFFDRVLLRSALSLSERGELLF